MLIHVQSFDFFSRLFTELSDFYNGFSVERFFLSFLLGWGLEKVSFALRQLQFQGFGFLFVSSSLFYRR